jgi:hypothetical protein
MTEASPICPACVKGEEGEAEVGVEEEGERLTTEVQLCFGMHPGSKQTTTLWST